MVLLFAIYVLFSFSPTSLIVSAVLILMAGIWSLIEGIIFIKAGVNKSALPLVLLAILIALYALFIGIGAIATSAFDLVEGGPFQLIGYLFFFVLVIIIPVLAIWAVVKGIILIRSKKNVKLGVASLIIGGIVAIPVLIILFGVLFSRLEGPSIK